MRIATTILGLLMLLTPAVAQSGRYRDRCDDEYRWRKERCHDFRNDRGWGQHNRERDCRDEAKRRRDECRDGYRRPGFRIVIRHSR